MPQQYRSNPGGLYNSGVQPDSRPRIDIGPIFEALTGGASSMLQHQILRQQNSNELAQRKAELALRQQEATARQTESDREFGLRETTERHRALEAGIIPGHSEISQVGGTAPINTLNAPRIPQSPIQGAMLDRGMPGVQVTPSNAPASLGPNDRLNANIAPAAAPQSTTVYHPEATNVPETFDPNTGQRAVIEHIRQLGMGTREEHKAEAQADLQQKRLAMQMRLRAFSAQAAKELAEYRAKVGTAKGAVQKAITGNALESANEKIAAGFLATVQEGGGTLEDAEQELQKPEHADLRKLGVGKAHLLAAYGKSSAAGTNQALKFQLGPTGRHVSAEAAAGRVGETRAAVGRLGKKPTPSTFTPEDPFAPAPEPTPTPVGGPRVGAPNATVPTKAAAPTDDFSDDEVLAAHKAGKRSDDDIAAWIRTKRKGAK